MQRIRRLIKLRKERDLAYRINAIGARNVAVASQLVEAKLVYISTDYVFQGDRPEGYDEFHNPAPINIYGASKYAGEQFVKELHNKYFIVRTSWLYGKYGNNFVKTMMRLGKRRRSICCSGSNRFSYVCGGFKCND